MARRARFLTLGLLAFVAGIVLFFPARVAYQWLAPPELKLNGIHGTIWHGNASEASVRGVYLHGLQWQIHPLNLLGAKASYSIEGKFVSGFLQADIAIDVSGALTVSELAASMTLAELQPALGIPGLGGNLSLQFSRLRAVDGLPVAADGEISVAQLVVPFVFRDSLGDFRAEFFTEDAAVVASLEDSDALIDLAGSLRISADRKYRLSGQLAATADTPATLQQFMAAGLGPANARGQHEFGIEGML